MAKQFFDAIPTSSIETTPEGYVRGMTKVTRIGVFDYRDDNGKPIKVLRHPDDVFKEESLKTLKGIPITINHPSPFISATRLVNSDNAKELTIGMTGEQTIINSPFIENNINLYDKEGIKEVKTKYQEISLGYTADVIDEEGEYDGEYYTQRQINILYNHLSFVAKGRAGPEVRIHFDNAEKTMANVRNVIIDNNAYEVPAEVSTHVDKMQADMQALKDMLSKSETDREELETELDAKKGELDNTKGELDTTKEQLDAALKKSTHEAINDAAKERLGLFDDVRKLGVVIDKADTLTNLEIIKQVISKKAPNATLDGKSDDYIMGRFEALRSSIVDEATQKVHNQMKTISDNFQGGQTRTAEQAQAEMIGRMTKKK